MSRAAFPKQAMILTAGRGTRLGELGRRRAKVLIEVDDTPLLSHHLRYLSWHGVERVVINASHLAEQLEEFARRHHAPPELQVSIESEPLGTAGGVIKARPMFASGRLLVIYGDVMAGEDLRPMAALHDQHRPGATLAVYHSDRVETKGVMELSGSRITTFREKDPTLTSGWVNAGIYVIELDWLARYPSDRPLDFGLDIFPAALRAGDELRAFRLDDPVLDIGTEPDLAEARRRGLPALSGVDAPSGRA